MNEQRTALIVGDGLIGAAVRHHLVRDGWTVTTARRTPRATDGQVLDVGTAAGRSELSRIIDSGAHSVCVLIHGPSDVTWCDSNEALATEAHQGAAAAAAGRGIPVVLVSTDNLFPGDRPGYGTEEPTTPPNAYGRAKVLAEREILADPAGRVVRVSLVYGPREDSRLRPNFAEDCLLTARDGTAAFDAPVDQSFTPIFVEDTAKVTAYVAAHPAAAPPLVHAAGTEVCSRFDFAREAFRVAGADPDRVRPVQRRTTRWASRPRYSCLTETASALDARLRPRSIHDGLVDTWSRLKDQPS